jgi:hypothetical protein
MFTRSSVRVLLLGVVAIGIFLAPALAAAQAAQPAPVGGLGLGRPATPGDIQRINIDVRPDGEASSNNRESPRSLLQTPGAVSGTLRLVISRSVAAHRREKPLFVSWTPPLFLQQRCRLPRRAQTLGQRNRYALRVHAGRTRYGREVTFAQRKLRTPLLLNRTTLCPGDHDLPARTLGDLKAAFTARALPSVAVRLTSVARSNAVHPHRFGSGRSSC